MRKEVNNSKEELEVLKTLSVTLVTKNKISNNLWFTCVAFFDYGHHRIVCYDAAHSALSIN